MLLLVWHTLLVVVLGFVLFRASSLQEALGILGRMFALGGGAAALTLPLQSVLDGTHILALLAGVLLSAPLLPALTRRLPGGGVGELIRDGAALCLVLLCLLAMVGSGFTPFIYAQF